MPLIYVKTATTQVLDFCWGQILHSAFGYIVPLDRVY